MDTFISSPRLLFREWREEDKEELFLAASDNEIGPMAGWQPHKSVEDSLNVIRLSKEGDSVFRVGLGIGKKDMSYYYGNMAIYLCGVIDNQYGFYRSFDECETYERINTDRQMFGDINSIDGDKNVFGRFFIATGSRGVLYGKPCEEV